VRVQLILMFGEIGEKQEHYSAKKLKKWYPDFWNLTIESSKLLNVGPELTALYIASHFFKDMIERLSDEKRAFLQQCILDGDYEPENTPNTLLYKLKFTTANANHLLEKKIINTAEFNEYIMEVHRAIFDVDENWEDSLGYLIEGGNRIIRLMIGAEAADQSEMTAENIRARKLGQEFGEHFHKKIKTYVDVRIGGTFEKLLEVLGDRLDTVNGHEDIDPKNALVAKYEAWADDVMDAEEKMVMELLDYVNEEIEMANVIGLSETTDELMHTLVAARLNDLTNKAEALFETKLDEIVTRKPEA